MKVTKLQIEGLLLIEPDVYADDRGYFFESFNDKKYEEHIQEAFVQDNESFSTKGVLRGMHLQLEPHAQGKLVRVISGEILDVAVDLRLESKTFGQHVAVHLSGDTKKQFWIPTGFAHGFLTLSETALFAYKCTEYYNKEAEIALQWNDPTLNIDWGDVSPTVVERDKNGYSLEKVKNILGDKTL